MSHLYTTKALGREWLPSSIKQGRYNEWMLSQPNLRSWKNQYDQLPSLAVLWLGSFLKGDATIAEGWVIHGSSVNLGSHGAGANKEELDLLKVHHVNASWSDFAYVTYATDEEYLCNSVMLVEALQRLGSRADRVIMYPEHYDLLGTERTQAKLLRKARDEYGATMAPIKAHNVRVPDSRVKSGFQNEASATKIYAFNQTQYRSVLALDSDGTLLQHMDDLFLLPQTPIAMPRAYWKNDESDGNDTTPEPHTALALLTPSTETFTKLQQTYHSSHETGAQLLTRLHAETSPSAPSFLPHRPNVLTSAEFRATEHKSYLQSSSSHNVSEEHESAEPQDQPWSAPRVLAETRFVHFEDAPMRKPWLPQEPETRERLRPKCTMTAAAATMRTKSGSVARGQTAEEDCRDRDAWDWLYADFLARRREVCATDP